jgi:hypothetical protein
MTKRKHRPVGQTLGGIIVGVDYQIFRATKPPAEMVESARPIRRVAAEGGGTIEVDLPSAVEAPPPPDAEDDPAT